MNDKSNKCLVPDCTLPICKRCGFCKRAHNKKGLGISQATGNTFCEGFAMKFNIDDDMLRRGYRGDPEGH